MSAFLALLPQLIPLFLSVLSPVVTAQVKKIAPKVPKVLVPLTSVAVGTAGALAVDALAGTKLGPLGGAAAGAVGVAIREVVDQTQKALSGV